MIDYTQVKDVENTTISNHPCFRATSDILPIIAPLERYFGVTHFCHIKRYPDSSHVIVTNTPDFSELFIKEKFYKHSFCGDFDSYDTRNILGAHLGYDEVSVAMEQNKGMGNLFIITQKLESHLDIFSFGADAKNTAINQFYLNNQDLFENYVESFKDSAKPILDKLDKHRLLYPTNCIDKTNLSKHVCPKVDFQHIQKFQSEISKKSKSPNKKLGSLTQREFEVLHWQSQGKTMEEIGIILEITTRTVKAHIRNIKDKLSCESQFQLGLAYSKLKPLAEH
jgi:DNA-binding CsgD family transcriptional regulator